MVDVSAKIDSGQSIKEYDFELYFVDKWKCEGEYSNGEIWRYMHEEMTFKRPEQWL